MEHNETLTKLGCTYS